MTTAPTDSILTADIGNVNTRVALFDLVNGKFRFIAGGEARTTVEPPYNSLSEGLRRALEDLQRVSGRAFMDENDRLIMPVRDDGNGVDAFAATASAGDPLKVALVGLTPNVSLTSARRAALSTYIQVVDVIGLNDRRREEQQIDALLAAKPELVIIAGGTEGGSQAAVLKLAETVALAANLMPEGTRPEILFIGNSSARDGVREKYDGLCEVLVADNARPELNSEQLAPARRQLSWLFEHARLATLGGYTELAQWGGGTVAPTATAFGNVIRFLGEISDGRKGVLGVDVGSTATTAAAAFGKDLSLTVRSDLGVGHNAARVLSHTTVGQLMQWLPEEYSDEEVRDYLFNKTLAPAIVPYELRELYIEHALARQCLSAALTTAQAAWPRNVNGNGANSAPASFDPLIGAGAVLARAPHPGQAALMLLDGVQPIGVTRLMLDTNAVMAALGATAALNPVAVSQVLQAGDLMTLGVAVCLSGAARFGQEVARVKLEPANDDPVERKVMFGSLEVLPLPLGEEAKLTVRPSRGLDAGFGPNTAKTIPVIGGAVGVIIDARGRPIAFPKAPDRRREMVKQWFETLGEYSL
jgi:hypothetical protein